MIKLFFRNLGLFLCVFALIVCFLIFCNRQMTITYDAHFDLLLIRIVACLLMPFFILRNFFSNNPFGFVRRKIKPLWKLLSVLYLIGVLLTVLFIFFYTKNESEIMEFLTNEEKVDALAFDFRVARVFDWVGLENSGEQLKILSFEQLLFCVDFALAFFNIPFKLLSRGYELFSIKRYCSILALSLRMFKKYFNLLFLDTIWDKLIDHYLQIKPADFFLYALIFLAGIVVVISFFNRIVFLFRNRNKF